MWNIFYFTRDLYTVAFLAPPSGLLHYLTIIKVPYYDLAVIKVLPNDRITPSDVKNCYKTIGLGIVLRSLHTKYLKRYNDITTTLQHE